MFFNPHIPTVEFQQLLETDPEKRIASIHGNFLPSFASYHTLRLQKRGFLYEKGYLRGFKFSSNVLHVFFRFLSQSIDCEYNSLDFEGQTKSISKTKSSQMRWKTYIHAYKPGGAASRASANQNVLLPTSHPSEDARMARRQQNRAARLGNRQKNSRSS